MLYNQSNNTLAIFRQLSIDLEIDIVSIDIISNLIIIKYEEEWNQGN